MLEDNPFFLARAQGVGVISRELARGRRHRRPAAARLGRELRPPPRRAVFVVRGLRLLGAGRNRRRLLRALPRADGGVPRVDHDRPPGARQAARRARSRRGPALKSVAQIRIPKGEAYARVEGPRGEVGCYLVADGSAKPYRMKWRGASFSNLAVLPHIIPGPQGGRRRRHHGLGRSGVRRGGSMMAAVPPWVHARSSRRSSSSTSSSAS